MPFLSIVLALLGLIPVSPRLLAVAAAAVSSNNANYESLKNQAEGSYDEKSFGRAHELYVLAAAQAATADEKRWTAMRLADTTWRAAAANPSADRSAVNAARAALEELIRKSGDDHDRIWAEANESLGDLAGDRRLDGYSPTNPQLLAALDWWSSSPDLPLARRRYLRIVWQMAAASPSYRLDREMESATGIPRQVLVDAVSIADSTADRDHARFLLASQLSTSSAPADVERAYELLDAILRDGKQTEWYDDALATYASRLENGGAVIVLDNGEPGLSNDYTKALELYRRLLSEFTRAETPYYVLAQNAVERITKADVTVATGSTFLPRSEQQVVLSWRNVKEVELTLTPVDLVNDFAPSPSASEVGADAIVLSAKPLRNWTYATNDNGRHENGTTQLRLTPRLDPGAYVLTATAGRQSARTLVLVTDTTIVVHELGGKIQLLVCDAITGAPVAGAHARVHFRVSQNDGKQTIVAREADTKADGLAVFSRPDGASGSSLVVTTAGTAHQAYEVTGYGSSGSAADPWRIYAFTDRPAYRPDETVHWKFLARARLEGEWSTPANREIDYEVLDPKGSKVTSGRARLNAFGSFWSDLPLTAAMPLGSYTIVFKRVDGNHGQLGQATLFRLEEYKLPEFRVSVTTPEENGKRKLYRLGDTIEASIDASYYFGGPVANATVEAVVYEQPLVHRWHPMRDYTWYYDDEQSARNYGYRGQERKHETLKTDANGHAILHIDTPRDGSDTTYRIEARVVDASRREVRGEGTVRVSKQRYFADLQPEHFLRLPSEKASIGVKTLDANDQPVQTKGTVRVVRRWWEEESWLDPSGRVVSGTELDRLKSAPFPPPPPLHGNTRWWRPKPAGYHDEEITTATVATDAQGDGTFTFTPPRIGYYFITWTSEDRDASHSSAPLRARDVVHAETAIWVADRNATELGYHIGDLQILVDKETFRVGQTASAIVMTPSSGRWVMLTTSADQMLDTQMLHLDGTVKLVQVKIDERQVPSFSLTATSVFDRMLAEGTASVVVPPVEHFIDVSVKGDRQQYEPRQKGTVTVTTRDVDGKPVAAEVALSVFDESVTAIGADPARDPREFFFGKEWRPQVEVTASVREQSYQRLIETEDGALIDDRQIGRLSRRDKDEINNGYVVSGSPAYDYRSMEKDTGGLAMDRARPVVAPAPPMAMTKSAVAEAITVTASAPAVLESAEVSTVQVRSDFRATAFWQPDVMTGPDGTATITLDYPEALTTWSMTARAATTASQFGIGHASARTKMPLIVRLQAPRFFVVGDRAVVSAVIDNNTNEVVQVTPSLEAEGLSVTGRVIDGNPVKADAGPVEIAANGETRMDWLVVAEKAGAAKLRAIGRGVAKSAALSDAMEKSFTVYEHGVDKLVARSGKLRGSEAVVSLDLPHERRAGSTALTVQIAPSLATTMLDALPYLIDYPYGCTEQTMSRFLPAAIVARTLAKNGLKPDEIEGRLFGGIESATAAATHPDGTRGLQKLDAITNSSMARLYDFQHGDGGWGWWKDGDSDPFMTAYVVWGFSIAKEGGLPVDASAISRAVSWLDEQLVKSENDPHAAAWQLHAVAAWRAAMKESSVASERKAFDRVYARREHLTAYGRALLALAAHDFGDAARAQVLIRNLEDGVKVDRSPDQSLLVKGSGANAAETMATAHWGEDRFWWRWYDGPVETTSFALQAIVAIDPQNGLVEPAMNWLIKNRRGAQWSNTRDTAISLLALNDYLKTSGELAGNVGYELSVNGRVIASKTLTPADVLSAPSRFVIDPALVGDSNRIRIRRTSGRADAALYFSAEGRFFSLEEPVKAAGNELFVRRDYYRMAARPTLLKGVVYDRVPLLDGGSIDSGERVEVVVTVETKNDYDYLLFEDLKPAGLEAIELQSGKPLFAEELLAPTVERKFAADGSPAGPQPGVVRHDTTVDQTGRSEWVNQELRDRKVALFVTHLPQGVWEIRYQLRAETPGSFHALPLLEQAMYVPEIRANGDEARIEVHEAKP